MAITVGAAGYSSVKPGQYDSSWGIPCPQRVWGTTGNMDTVIDASVHPGDCVIITPTSAGGIAPQGFWRVLVSQGQFVVTSSDSESAGMTYNYFICGN
jgi:hypothetical protein